MSPGGDGGEQRYFAAGSDFEDERSRLRLLEQGHDAATIRHLTNMGVGVGWHCLEVGAGAGSIACWLAEQVGPSGHVVALDRDVRFLEHLEIPNLEVRRQDVVEDSLEDDAYDLVHCRGLLFHMRDPEEITARMVRAARPGGCVLVEEADLVSFGPVDDDHPLARAGVLGRMVEFARTRRIWNPQVGRQLPSMLSRSGLVDVDNEAGTRVVQGGGAMALFVEKSYQRLDEACLAGGVITEAEIGLRRRAFGDPGFRFLNHLMVSAWGRRP